MPLARFGPWMLVLCCLAGCRSILGTQAANDKPSSADKRDVSGNERENIHRMQGSLPPDLFPEDLLAQARPKADFKKADLRPAGGTSESKTTPIFDLAPPVLPAIGPAIVPDPPSSRREDGPPREPIVEALRSILEGKHNEALTHLRKYDQPTQELFLRLLPVVAQLSKKSLDYLSPAEVAVLNEQLQALLTSLRPRTELTIDRMCFCEWVKGYGEYRPLAEGHVFQAATPSRPGELVQLYIELRNVASELRGEYFETRLTSTVEIHDPRTDKKWPLRFNEKEPFRTRTLLNDFFNVYSFHVPHLPPGTYSLIIQIADETRPDLRRVARRALEFRVSTVGR